MVFNWDPEKESANIAKHRIGFSEATEVFSDDFLELEDTRLYEGEYRWQVIGRTAVGRTLFVVVTYRGECTRIISARLAERAEVDRFFDHLFGLL
ncbi:MAG: BrnT family toxin [Rhodothermales bacterium]